MTGRLPSVFPASAGALLIVLTVLMVGRPSVFTDTRDYFIHGARFYQTIRRDVLGQAEARPPATPAGEREWARQQWAKHFNHSNMAARSPYYGVFLYTLAHRGTLWMMTLVQSLICAWLVFLLWRSAAPAAPGWTYYALMAALAAGTSLPWIASFAVPDIFAPALAAAVALTFLYRDRLERWERTGVWLIMAAAIAFHSSHLLLAVAMVPVAFGLGLLIGSPRRELTIAAGLTALAAGVAVGALALYSAAISWKTGDEFRRPPFLMARVLADGPGRAYLRASCAAGTPWVICRYKDLPLAKSDDILWSALPATGVFNRSNYQDRVRMEKQETAFVLGAIAYDPGGQFLASMRNWGLQLGRFWVDDPLRRPRAFLNHKYWGKTNLVGLIRGVGPCGAKGELCEPSVKISQLAFLDDAVVYVALGLLAIGLVQRASLGRLVRGRRLDGSEGAGRATAMALLLAAAVVLNAGVCGIFSGPFPRYQARIVWLAPAAAMLLALALVPAQAWSQRWFGLKAPVGWLAPARALWARVDPAFLRFGAVGAAGFSVDGLILYALVHGAGLNYFVGRLISFTIAVGVTWLLNRTWTFKVRRTDGRLREAAVYFAVQCTGGVANIGVYTAAILIAPVLKDWLIVPLAMGSAVGLCLTYLGAKHLAFRHRQNSALTRADGRAAEGASG